MTQDEKNKVGVALAFTAQYYGREFKKEVLALMVGDLCDLQASAVLEALNAYRRDPRSRTFPLPAQIRDMICPVTTNDAAAREVLGRIRKAITSIGGYESMQAKEQIGSAGWQYVEEMGGWNHLCFNTDFLTNTSMQAQCRDRLIDLLKHGSHLSNFDRNVVTHENKLKIEAARQKEEFLLQASKPDVDKKPDPNSDYLSKTPEERKLMIENLMRSVKSV